MSEQKTIIEVSRINHHYFYSLTRDGEVIAKNQVITRDRAMQIVAENEDGKVVSGEGVDFGERSAYWEWVVEG